MRCPTRTARRLEHRIVSLRFTRRWGPHRIGYPVKHIWTRPYRPQTNGKVERFNRTLAQEWAYADTYLSDEARAATYPAWLHYYNHHRPHGGIGGATPSDRVHNLTGNYN